MRIYKIVGIVLSAMLLLASCTNSDLEKKKVKIENLDKKVAQKEEEAKQAKVAGKPEKKSSNKVVVAVRPVNGGKITSRFGERSSITRDEI